MTDTDWEQFEDWCAATGHVPLPTMWVTVQDYLAAAPAAPATIRRRLGAIRARHVAARQLLAGAPPRPAPDAVWRTPGDLVDPAGDPNGPRWLDLAEALHHLPVHGFPHGIVARRDAVVLALAARGWTRQRIVDLTPAQIRLEPVPAVDQVDLPMTGHGLTCPSCALTRWLRVLAAVYDDVDGAWEPVSHVVERHPADVRLHDCGTPVPGGWRRARHVLPVIDRYGHIEAGTCILPRRRVSAICATAQHPALAAAHQPAQPQPATRLASTGWRPPTLADRAAQLHDLDDVLDELDTAIDAASADFTAVLERIDNWSSPRPTSP